MLNDCLGSGLECTLASDAWRSHVIRTVKPETRFKLEKTKDNFQKVDSF